MSCKPFFSREQEDLLNSPVKAYNEFLEEVIKKILWVKLKREPVIEDCKRITIGHYQGQGDIDIAFDKEPVGRVTTKLNDYILQFNFEPFNNNQQP